VPHVFLSLRLGKGPYLASCSQDIAERDRDIHRLVGDTLDMQRIAQDIGGLIEEQGYAVDEIAVQVENISHNIDSGAGEIERARARQRSFRIDLCGWICIALGIVCGLYVASL
jgi:t-SNARE complex subunit (syntaxin)